MACPAIITGESFVTRVITHIDCQAQYLGSYGYQSLGEPGSPVSFAVTGLLTLFVALWGLRLLLGPSPEGRDLVYDIIKVGIVLTLAFSWPAFRTVIHDVVLNGPAELAASISTPGLGATGASLVDRLQAVDNAIVSLIESGTGRGSGQFIDDAAVGGTFAGSALEDESAYGWARLAYLAGMFGSLALVRIIAGLLLALAPLAAGLLLFEVTRGLFAGWLRGLVFALVASLGLTVTLAIELAMLEPWLADARNVRQLGYATPAAPVELFAMMLAFALLQFGLLWLLARATFHGGLAIAPSRLSGSDRPGDSSAARQGPREERVVSSRAEHLSSQIDRRLRTEQQAPGLQLARSPAMDGAGRNEAGGSPSVPPRPRLGASYRRRGGGASLSSTRRDGNS